MSRLAEQGNGTPARASGDGIGDTYERAGMQRDLVPVTGETAGDVVEG